MTTVTRIFITCCLVMYFGACAGSPEPVDPHVKLARNNAFYYDKGQTYFAMGCYAKALSYFEDAHERYTAADDAVGIAQSLNSIANIYLRLDDPQSALALYNDAIGAYERNDDSRGVVLALSNKAAALIAAGQLAQAAETLDQADARATKNQQLIALRMKTRALLMIQQGDKAGALKVLNQALSQTEESEMGIKADIHYTLGQLVLADDPKQACGHFNAALALDHQVLAHAQTAKDLKALGLCTAAQGMDNQALAYLKRGAKIFALIGDEIQIAQLTPLMEDSARKTGADIQAVQHYISQWMGGETESNLCQ